ncbi:MAG TPA: hypothetical protein VFB78_02410 [Acidimicrobiales bacterium]|nr:hypothetical protein [Acidimicrobiales bacterium]
MRIPYGDGAGDVGIDPVKGGGPEGGAPYSSGEWAILDTQNARIARFGSAGESRGAVALPSGGWQGGFVLDDQWFVATSSSDAVVADTRVARAATLEPKLFFGNASDGHSIYGQDSSGVLHALRVVGGLPHLTTVDAYRAVNGTRYRIGRDNGVLRLELLDRKPPLELRMRMTSESGAAVEPALEWAGDADGGIHLVFYGNVLDGDDIAAYLVVSKTGEVSPAERLPSFFSQHGGSVAHLRLIGGSVPALMLFGDDAMRIYTRDAAATGG